METRDHSRGGKSRRMIQSHDIKVYGGADGGRRHGGALVEKLG